MFRHPTETGYGCQASRLHAFFGTSPARSRRVDDLRAGEWEQRGRCHAGTNAPDTPARFSRSAIRRPCARTLRATNKIRAVSIDCIAVRKTPKIRLCLESTFDRA